MQDHVKITYIIFKSYLIKNDNNNNINKIK